MISLNGLFASVDESAQKDEETFFQYIGARLHELCEQIARDVDADSCALFFVTEEPIVNGLRYMVMRGAAGRLRYTFNRRIAKWRERRFTLGPLDTFEGFAYAEKKDEPGLSADNAREWSVTSQIWHLAEGRIANSNRAMDELHGGMGRVGSGDSIAYPDKNLHTTFRGMIAVPIFAQGGSVLMARLRQANPKGHTYPPDASPSGEFLSKYRVIGILKIEGKRPSSHGTLAFAEVKRRLDDLFRHLDGIGHKVPKPNREHLLRWTRQIGCSNIKDLSHRKNKSRMSELFGPKGRPFPEFLHRRAISDTEERERVAACRGFGDIFSRIFHAEFTRQDMELLVLMAMQVGRILSRRIIKKAASTKMLLSENEVGSLNIRWRDIDQLAALWRAAEAAKAKVLHHLDALKEELDFHRHQEVYGTRVSEFLNPRGPIRSVDARIKEPSSLIRKLLKKELEFHQEPIRTKLSTHVEGTLIGYGNNVGQECVLRGRTRLYIHRTGEGNMEADISLQLGLEDAPRFIVRDQGVEVTLKPAPMRGASAGALPTASVNSVGVSESNSGYQHSGDRSLVYRILAPDWYRVDDLAGARIIADYDSHIEQVLDEIRARSPLWRIQIGPHVDDFRDGRRGGYRAVHVTLYVDVEPLLATDDMRQLHDALDLTAHSRLSIPVEVQLRTAYQNS